MGLEPYHQEAREWSGPLNRIRSSPTTKLSAHYFLCDPPRATRRRRDDYHSLVCCRDIGFLEIQLASYWTLHYGAVQRTDPPFPKVQSWRRQLLPHTTLLIFICKGQ